MSTDVVDGLNKPAMSDYQYSRYDQLLIPHLCALQTKTQKHVVTSNLLWWYTLVCTMQFHWLEIYSQCSWCQQAILWGPVEQWMIRKWCAKENTTIHSDGSAWNYDRTLDNF